MSSLINKYLVFDKVWKRICMIVVFSVFIGLTLFCLIYTLISSFKFYKLPISVISIVCILILAGIYLLMVFKKKKVFIVLLSILLVLFIALESTLTFMLISGKSAMLKNNNVHIIPPNIDSVIDANGIITYEGKKYIYNENMTTILFMGIDKDDIDDTSINGKNGQADAVYAVAINTETGETTAICISRDTLTDIKIYSKEGNYIRTENKQLCLSYAYGDGKELSCESCVWSASNILCGIPINTYMALDYSAIAVLNDAVGGVEVPKYTRDWSKKTGGTTVLRGKKAYEYVKFRDITKTESNKYRITRQIDYLTAFSAKAINMTKKDISTPVNLYNKINKYSVNTLSVDRITFLSSVFLSGSTKIRFESIEGTIDTDGKHAYFVPDYEKLYELVLDVFYKEV